MASVAAPVHATIHARRAASWQGRFVQAVADIAASVESREPGLRDETDLPG